MNIYTLLITCLLSLTGCYNYFQDPYGETDRVAVAREMKKLGFSYLGTMHDPNLATYQTRDKFSSYAYRLASVEEARNVFCKAFLLYFKTLNDNLKQGEQPYTYKNANVFMIFMREYDCPEVWPRISTIRNEKGIVIYSSLNVAKKEMEIVYQEPIETALKLYQADLHHE